MEREEADPRCSPEVSALHTPRPSALTSLQLAGLAQCLSWHKHYTHGATPPRLTLKDLAELGAMQMSEKLSMSQCRGVSGYEDVFTSVQAHEVAA